MNLLVAAAGGALQCHCPPLVTASLTGDLHCIANIKVVKQCKQMPRTKGTNNQSLSAAQLTAHEAHGRGWYAGYDD